VKCPEVCPGAGKGGMDGKNNLLLGDLEEHLGGRMQKRGEEGLSGARRRDRGQQGAGNQPYRKGFLQKGYT